MKNIFFIILVPSLAISMSRQELRKQWKDDLHQWLAPEPAQADTCRICLEPKKDLSSLACHKTHLFCRPCISQWLEEQNTCPVCRKEIVDSVWCTCLKSLAKPPVVMAAGVATVTGIKFLENADAYLKLITPTIENNCTLCASFAISASAAVLMGFTIYNCSHPKDD